MTDLVSYAQQRRTVAVGRRGVQLGLDLVPGVVLVDVVTGEDAGHWMPDSQVIALVWCSDARKAWQGVLEQQRVAYSESVGLTVVLVAQEPHRWPWSWARWRAWWRWQVRPRAAR